MTTIRKSCRHAFLNGFWQWLSSPIVLFGTRHLTDIEPIAPIKARKRSDLDAMRQDWERIGRYFPATTTK